jgi:hypothetical protein
MEFNRELEKGQTTANLERGYNGTNEGGKERGLRNL